MQSESFPENATFFCADCKAQFNSAALLLNHFSQHIYMLEKLEGSQNKSCLHKKNTLVKENSASMFHPNQERTSESILEQVLRQSLLDVSSCDSNVIESTSSNSNYSASTTENDACSSEHESQIPIPVIEIGRRSSPENMRTSDMMLAKFDLQQRLENCIFKLASKKDFTIERDTLPKATKSMQTLNVNSSKINPEQEDFNPLTFCVVTMEEGEDNIEFDATKFKVADKVPSPRSSNRKQRTPRKIQHVEKNAEARQEAMDIQEKKDLALGKVSKKKYPCNVCWKVFGWSTDLKRHVLTHTGERPFKCLQCTATFTRNFLLQKHETKVHQGPIILTQVPLTDSSPTTTDNFLPRPMLAESVAPIVEKQLKRKIKNRPIWNKKQMVCKSIPLGIFTPKALNIL